MMETLMDLLELLVRVASILVIVAVVVGAVIIARTRGDGQHRG